MAAVRDSLVAGGELTAEAVTAGFKRAGVEDVTAVLESLAAVGVAVEVTAPTATERRWRATR
jgi:hypothetical protein